MRPFRVITDGLFRTRRAIDSPVRSEWKNALSTRFLQTRGPRPPHEIDGPCVAPEAGEAPKPERAKSVPNLCGHDSCLPCDRIAVHLGGPPGADTEEHEAEYALHPVGGPSNRATNDAGDEWGGSRPNQVGRGPWERLVRLRHHVDLHDPGLDRGEAPVRGPWRQALQRLKGASSLAPFNQNEMYRPDALVVPAAVRTGLSIYTDIATAFPTHGEDEAGYATLPFGSRGSGQYPAAPLPDLVPRKYGVGPDEEHYGPLAGEQPGVDPVHV